MRKVSFKEWIPTEWIQKDGRNISEQVKGTGCWSKDYTGTGLFHQWANACEEYSNGAGNYTVALVELEDGTIKEVLPFHVKFEEK